MIVDVVPLRRDGRRLPEFAVREQVPVRGSLGIEPEDRLGYTAHLRDSIRGADLFRPLKQCRVGPMRGDSFVVSGVQETQPAGAPLWLERQAWWCRLPSDDLAVAQRLLLARMGVGAGVLTEAE